jgi:hypothetical protein
MTDLHRDYLVELAHPDAAPGHRQADGQRSEAAAAGQTGTSKEAEEQQ